MKRYVRPLGYEKVCVIFNFFFTKEACPVIIFYEKNTDLKDRLGLY